MPKLSKTQKKFRKKMKRLVKQGKIKDQYGKTIKPEKERHNIILLIGIALLIAYIAYTLKTNEELIKDFITKIIEYI